MTTTTPQDAITLTGGKPLKGEIALSGAKNAVSKIMVASLLTEEVCTLESVPEIEDVSIVKAMLEELGSEVQFKAGSLVIKNENLKNFTYGGLQKVAGKSRIPILFAGPLLHRLGEATLPRLGGCQIGPRPVDFHTQALEKMGAEIENSEQGLRIRTARLRGEKIALDYPSVGATEQVLLAAVTAEGKTELTNAAVEPEIMDLVKVLQQMGALISVDTNRTYTITGVEKLFGFTHQVIPDRMEAASWACAAAASRGEVFVKGARQEDLITFLNKFRMAGGHFEISSEGILFSREAKLNAIAIETDVHPGFMTDWQQPFTILMTQAEGASIIHETVYENRFGYTSALNRMGAKIQLFTECLGGNTHCRFGQRNHLHSAVIIGPTPLHGYKILIPNLRAGFSYIIAGLIAEGKTTLTNISTIYRGYEHFEDKLKALGVEINDPASG